MARVALVLVVLGRAGEAERVVAPDRVANDLDQRVLVDVVELPMEAGLRVCLAHERAGRRRVEPAFEPVLELAPVERQEVGALFPLDVDHLDELAGAHLVRESGRRVDAEVETRLGEQRGEFLLLVPPRLDASDLDVELRRGRGSVHDAPRRGCHHDRHGALGPERLRRARRRVGAEEADCPRRGGVEPLGGEGRGKKAVVRARERGKDDGRRSVGPCSECGRVVTAVGAEDCQLGDLTAVRVDDRDPLVGSERQDRRSPGAHEVRLEERVFGEEPAPKAALSAQ